MATDTDNLQTAYENLLSALLDATANPKPNYAIGGQNVSWGDFIKMLTDGMKAILEAKQLVDPYWIQTIVLP